MAVRHTKRLLAGALTLLAMACVWLYFAPTGIGGSTSYVVTDGISMEPHFHAGDLVVVRRQSSYPIGEIVAYRNTMLGTVVLHRIVGRSGARYVFKGDNNNFKDFEHPARSQLIGALWLHLPGVGTRLKSLRSPGLLGALGALGTFLLVGALFARRRRRRRRRTPIAEQIEPPARDTQWYARPPVIVVLVALMALLPCVAFVFTRPSRTLAPVKVAYTQSGTLSYSAPTPNSPVYPGGALTTGDPIFTHVVSALEMRFHYRFHSAATGSIKGKAMLQATVTATNGWHMSMRLGHPLSFRGEHAQLTATLDVGSLLALLRRVEAATAVGGSYTLTLVPHVETTGRVGSVPLATTFFSQAQFSLNRLEIQPATASAGKAGAGQFSHVSSGSVAGRHYVPLRVLQVPIATARRLVLGAIAVLILLLLAIVKLVGSRVSEETARILKRYGHVIIPVECVWQLPGVAVIDVEEMEALARIAERYDRSILYEKADWGDAFWVTDESGHFRYAVLSPSRLAEAESLYGYASEPAAPTAQWVVEEPAEVVGEGGQVEELVRDVALNGNWSAQVEPL
jgi:signal peptidase I